jgi:hypothetical protein
MTFTNNLKAQLIDFVDSYKNYFGKTLVTALAYSVLCFLSIAVLLHFTEIPSYDTDKISLQTFLWSHNSYLENYYLTDLTIPFFVFFISLFSLSLLRQACGNIEDSHRFSFNAFINQLTLNDLFFLIIALICTSGLDYLFFKLGEIPFSISSEKDIYKWLYAVVVFFRTYTPFVIFSITINKLYYNKKIIFHFKKLFFLIVLLWLFHEFSYELYIFSKFYIFRLILSPFASESKFLFENLLGIALISVYFVGYYSAMTLIFKQSSEENE